MPELIGASAWKRKPNVDKVKIYHVAVPKERVFFMVKQVWSDPAVYRIEVDLPQNPLHNLNVYWKIRAVSMRLNPVFQQLL